MAAMAAITPGDRGLEFEQLERTKRKKEKNGQRGQFSLGRRRTGERTRIGRGRRKEERRETHSSDPLDEDWKGESTDAVSVGAAETAVLPTALMVPEG